VSAKPRLVHRPRSGEPSAARHEPRREGAVSPAETVARDELWPGADGVRDAMRDVQMENIHPLRLRLLLEIERTKSISAAAQACGIGQPSASMHLRNLEATLAHRLVMRNGRGSSLTPAGKVVAPHAARMLATLDSMRRAVDALGAQGGGELTIAASHMPSVVLVLPVLARLTERYPGITVKLRTVASDAAVREVARGRVDVGIAGEVPAPEPVTRSELVVDELVGIASPVLLDPDDGRISLGQLARHRLLLGPAGSSTRAVAERELARAGYRPASIWELDSFEAISRAVKQALGISFVSGRLIGDELERREVIAFRVSDVEPMLRPIHALWHTAREQTAEVLAFMALIEEHAAPSAAPMAAAS
jgi:LysR family transcriptional regulator, low CO2-responsive transcriptional regulator